MTKQEFKTAVIDFATVIGLNNIITKNCNGIVEVIDDYLSNPNRTIIFNEDIHHGDNITFGELSNLIEYPTCKSQRILYTNESFINGCINSNTEFDEKTNNTNHTNHTCKSWWNPDDYHTSDIGD